jgi:hypothetical protein
VFVPDLKEVIFLRGKYINAETETIGQYDRDSGQIIICLKHGLTTILNSILHEFIHHSADKLGGGQYSPRQFRSRFRKLVTNSTTRSYYDEVLHYTYGFDEDLRYLRVDEMTTCYLADSILKQRAVFKEFEEVFPIVSKTLIQATQVCKPAHHAKLLLKAHNLLQNFLVIQNANK